MPLKTWLNEHKQHYVAHAIWTNNVDKVLQDTILKSSEQVLREKLKVSYEAGMKNIRCQMDISKIYNHFKENNIRLPRCIKVETEALRIMSLYDAVDNEYLTEEQANTLLETKLTDLPEKIEIAKGITFATNGLTKRIVVRNQLKITHSAYGLEEKSVLAVKDQIQAHSATFSCTEFPIQIANDMLLEKPVDKLLSEYWNAKHKPNQDNRKLLTKLCQIRECEIRASSVNAEIRGSLNTILWDYGDVVVLVGNPQSLLSNHDGGIYSQRDTSQQLADFILGGREVFFKHPIENNGEFFSIDLKQADILVLGPEAKLAAYRTSGMNLVAFESMNQEELDFFKVPANFRQTQVPTHSVFFLRDHELNTSTINAAESKQTLSATLQ